MGEFRQGLRENFRGSFPYYIGFGHSEINRCLIFNSVFRYAATNVTILRHAQKKAGSFLLTCLHLFKRCLILKFRLYFKTRMACSRKVNTQKLMHVPDILVKQTLSHLELVLVYQLKS